MDGRTDARFECPDQEIERLTTSAGGYHNVSNKPPMDGRHRFIRRSRQANITRSTAQGTIYEGSQRHDFLVDYARFGSGKGQLRPRHLAGRCLPDCLVSVVSITLIAPDVANFRLEKEGCTRRPFLVKRRSGQDRPIRPGLRPTSVYMAADALAIAHLARWLGEDLQTNSGKADLSTGSF
jgi:hypothetical protein